MSRTVLSTDPAWLKAAFKDLGLSEIAGSRHEPRVLAMYKKAGHPEVSDDETAWCAAGVGCWLAEAGEPNTGSLMARSYTSYGRRLNKSETLPRGAICVWPRGAPPSGHVNLCLEDDGVYLTCIGANQGNGKGGGVTISRELKAHLVSATMPVSWAAKPKPPSPPKVAAVDVEDDIELSAQKREQPVELAPTPPAPEPKEDADKPGFFRRVRNKVVGVTGSVGGFGFLTYLTDWQVALIFFVAAFVATGSLIWFLFWLFGKDAVRDWIRKQVN